MAEKRATIEVYGGWDSEGNMAAYTQMRYVRLMSRDAVGVRVMVEIDGEEWLWFIPYTSIRRMQLIE